MVKSSKCNNSNDLLILQLGYLAIFAESFNFCHLILKSNNDNNKQKYHQIQRYHRALHCLHCSNCFALPKQQHICLYTVMTTRAPSTKRCSILQNAGFLLNMCVVVCFCGGKERVGCKTDLKVQNLNCLKNMIVFPFQLEVTKGVCHQNPKRNI